MTPPVFLPLCSLCGAVCGVKGKPYHWHSAPSPISVLGLPTCQIVVLCSDCLKTFAALN